MKHTVGLTNWEILISAHSNCRANRTVKGVTWHADLTEINGVKGNEYPLGIKEFVLGITGRIKKVILNSSNVKFIIDFGTKFDMMNLASNMTRLMPGSPDA